MIEPLRSQTVQYRLSQCMGRFLAWTSIHNSSEHRTDIINPPDYHRFVLHSFNISKCVTFAFGDLYQPTKNDDGFDSWDLRREVQPCNCTLIKYIPPTSLQQEYGVLLKESRSLWTAGTDKWTIGESKENDMK